MRGFSASYCSWETGWDWFGVARVGDHGGLKSSCTGHGTRTAVLTQPQAIMASPSSLLQSLSQSRTPTTFNNVVLAKYLCPALDALPADQRTNILRILQEAERASCHEEPLHFDKLVLDSDSDDDHHVESVDFELHSRTIKALLATRASTQIIAEQITNWLSLLWRVGAEHGLESKGVHSALAFCMDVEYVFSFVICNSH